MQGVAKARLHGAIRCTQLFSNPLILESSLWFRHNSTEELYDTNCIV